MNVMRLSICINVKDGGHYFLLLPHLGVIWYAAKDSSKLNELDVFAVGIEIYFFSTSQGISWTENTKANHIKNIIGKIFLLKTTENRNRKIFGNLKQKFKT